MSCGCENRNSCSAIEGRLAEVWGGRVVAPTCKAEVPHSLDHGPGSSASLLESTGSFDFIFPVLQGNILPYCGLPLK